MLHLQLTDCTFFLNCKNLEKSTLGICNMRDDKSINNSDSKYKVNLNHPNINQVTCCQILKSNPTVFFRIKVETLGTHFTGAQQREKDHQNSLVMYRKMYVILA